MPDVTSPSPDIALVAYWYEPCRRWPTAADRVAGLARGLARRGWSPVVVAPDLQALCGCGGCDGGGAKGAVPVLRVPVEPWPGAQSAAGRIGSVDVRGDRSVIQRLAAPLAGLFEVRNDWVPAAEAAVLSSGWSGSLEAVWTTSPPFRSAVVGSRLRERLGVPWIADLRDQVSQVRGQDRSTVLATRAGRRAIRPHLRAADRVVGVTPELAALDEAWLSRPVDTIMSGFDPAAWKGLAEPPSGEFRVTYAGTFYPGYRSPDLAVRGIARFVEDLPRDERDRVCLVYLGRDVATIQEAVSQAGGGVRVEAPGFLAGRAYRERLSATNVLLHLGNDRGDAGVPGGKLFDYLGAGRPILSVPGSDPFVTDVLCRTGTGRTAGDVDEIVSVLRRWHERWTRDGAVPHDPDEEQLRKFTIWRAADELAGVLEATVPGRAR